MNKSNIKTIFNQKPIDVVLEVIWLIAIFFIPLFFLLKIYNIFEISKIIVFQFLTSFLLLVYLIKLLFYKEDCFNIFKQRGKHLIPAGIFLIILGISTILSDVNYFSFWGSWERMMGYLTWLFLFMFSSILLLNIKTKEQINRIFFAIILSSLFVFIYGIIQAIGIDKISWTYDAFLRKRIFSTIGQPNFLGSWILLVMPLIFYSFIVGHSIKKYSFWVKFFSFILLFFSILCIFLTKSRGAWVGLIAMIMFASVMFLWRKNKKLILIPILFLIIFVSCFFFFATRTEDFNRMPEDSSFFNRIKSFYNIKKAGNYRFMHWKASIDLIKQSPIIGYGLGSQRFYFPKYYTPEFAVYENPNIYLDYAHNDILDVLLASGFLGLFSYLFFLAYVFYVGLKYFFKNKKQELLVLSILSGLFGYFVSIMFSFHVISTLLYSWIFIVLIILISNNLTKSPSKTKSTTLSPFKSLIIILLLISFIFVSWNTSIKSYLSSYYFFNAKKYKAYSQTGDSIKQHKKAIQFSPKNPYFRQEFALSLYQFSKIKNVSNLQKLYWLNTGIENIKKIPLNIRPIESLIWMPWLMAEKANITKKAQDFADAENAYKYISKQTPQTALVYNKWCELKIYEKKWNQAILMCEKALSLYPDINHPHINKDHQKSVVSEMSSAYLMLSHAYQQINKNEKAIDIIKKSVYLLIKTHSPAYPEILRQHYQALGYIYSKMGRYDLVEAWTKQEQKIFKKLNK